MRLCRATAALWVIGVVTGCAGTQVNVEPGAGALAGGVTVVVGLPNDIAYGTPAEQRRAQRRTGDSLLVLTRGHAILAEELDVPPGRGLTDKDVTDGVRAAGEDPEHALTFAILASRSRRMVANASALAGFELGKRLVMDYIVRLEVRQAGHSEIIGAINTVTSGHPNEGEVGAHGESLGLQKAIDEAIAQAVHTFAPGLIRRGAGGAAALPDLPVIVEVPPSTPPTTLARTEVVQELYPELSIDQIQVLAACTERFLVLRAGALASLGVTAGDLVAAPFGQTFRSRAALARIIARGGPVKLVVQRAGQRYLLAQGSPPPDTATR
jgi:hypothetical protein